MDLCPEQMFKHKQRTAAVWSRASFTDDDVICIKENSLWNEQISLFLEFKVKNEALFAVMVTKHLFRFEELKF